MAELLVGKVGSEWPGWAADFA